MGGRRGAYRILMEKPDGKRPLGRPRSRLQDNIKAVFMKWDGEAWTGLLWLRIGKGGGHLSMR